MNRLQRFSVTIPFCMALAAPVLVPIATAATTPAVKQDRDDHDHDRDDRGRRYYDEEHKDYHYWNADEERYWHEYWTYEHRPYIDWGRASEAQRRAYWHWRHEHHDHDDRR